MSKASMIILLLQKKALHISFERFPVILRKRAQRNF